MKYQEWKGMLNNAIDGNVTVSQLTKMELESSSWRTCAVGAKIMCDLKLDTLKGKTTVHEYVNQNINHDVFMKGLHHFPRQIARGDYVSALRILEEIYHTLNIHKSRSAKQKFKWNQRCS